MVFWRFVASSFFGLFCIFQQLKTIFESSLTIGQGLRDNLMGFSFEIVFFTSDSLFQNIFASFDIFSDLLILSDILRCLLIPFFCLFYLSLFLDLSDGEDAFSEDLNYGIEFFFIGRLKPSNVGSSKQIFIYVFQFKLHIFQSSAAIVHLLVCTILQKIFSVSCFQTILRGSNPISCFDPIKRFYSQLQSIILNYYTNSAVQIQFYTYIQSLMGNEMCNASICRSKQNVKRQQSFPLNTNFEPVTSEVEIKPQHDKLVRNIKKRLPIIDPRTNSKLNWYQSTKYGLYFYGALDKERPIGDCFFYSTKDDDESIPVLVTTNINQFYVFSDKTLIVNLDQTVYFGAIKNNIATLPRAEGKGVLFSPDFVYEGQFKNGSPHGYGHYRSRTLECVGQFKNGEPWGECIQKTVSELFVGKVISDRQRVGFKITNRNKRIPVNYIKQVSPVKDKQTKDAESKEPVESNTKEYQSSSNKEPVAGSTEV